MFLLNYLYYILFAVFVTLCKYSKFYCNITFIFAIMNVVINMEYKYTTNSEEDTIVLAQNFESEKFNNMVICLIGELGSGKTVFTKGFAGALGIDENITSPTFNIIKEYKSGEMDLYHMDVYRLEGDTTGLGLDEYLKKDGIIIIEWADMIRSELPEERLEIKFKISGEEKRTLTITPYGEKYETLCEDVL